jgi:hypothetical protein
MPYSLHEQHEQIYTLDAPLEKEQDIVPQSPAQAADKEDTSFIDSLLAVDAEEDDTEEEESFFKEAEEKESFDYNDMDMEEAFSRPMPPAIPRSPFYAHISVLCAANMVALLIVVCMSGLLWRESITAHFPFTQRLYQLVGYENTDGLKLADIVFSQTKIGKNTRYLVRGQMVNHGVKPYIVPSIRARLLQEDGELLEEWRLDNASQAGGQAAMLAVGAEKAFNLKLPVRYENAALLAVDIGSPFEIDRRK